MSSINRNQLSHWSPEWTIPELGWVGKSEVLNLGISRAAMEAYGIDPAIEGVDGPGLAWQLNDMEPRAGMPGTVVTVVAPQEKSQAWYAIHGKQRPDPAQHPHQQFHIYTKAFTPHYETPHTYRVAIGFNVTQEDEVNLQVGYFDRALSGYWETEQLFGIFSNPDKFCDFATTMIGGLVRACVKGGVEDYYRGPGRDESEFGSSTGNAYEEKVNEAVHDFLGQEN